MVKSGRKVINKSIHLLRPLPPVPLPPFPQVLLGDVDGRKNMLKQGGKKTKKQKIRKIKTWTDADTDSEVFRNALRLHLMLLRAHQNGARLFMKRDGMEEAVTVNLFVGTE